MGDSTNGGEGMRIVNNMLLEKFETERRTKNGIPSIIFMITDGGA